VTLWRKRRGGTLRSRSDKRIWDVVC